MGTEYKVVVAGREIDELKFATQGSCPWRAAWDAFLDTLTKDERMCIRLVDEYTWDEREDHSVMDTSDRSDWDPDNWDTEDEMYMNMGFTAVEETVVNKYHNFMNQV